MKLTAQCPGLPWVSPNPAPTDLKQFPRFPLMLVDDVPFLVVRGYTLAGQAEPGSADLANIRRTCLFRKVPLKPPTNLRKLAFDAISKAASLDDEQLTSDVANQVLRLTASVYEPRKRVDEGRILYHDFDAWWSAVKADLRAVESLVGRRERQIHEAVISISRRRINPSGKTNGTRPRVIKFRKCEQ